MKKVFLLTIEDWSEDSPDDNSWIEFITSSLDGGSIDVKCEVYNAAQQGVHPTVLNVREIETVCPNCNLVFDVPVPEPHSG